jgi:hypothetical protein
VKVFGKGSRAHVIGAKRIGERDAKTVAECRVDKGSSRLGAREIGVEKEGREWRVVGGVVAKVGDGLGKESGGLGEWRGKADIVDREGKGTEVLVIKGGVDVKAVAGGLLDR